MYVLLFYNNFNLNMTDKTTLTSPRLCAINLVVQITLNDQDEMAFKGWEKKKQHNSNLTKISIM